MNAIVFSCYIPTDDKLYILQEFFDVFLELFKDDVIFIGMNYGNTQSVFGLIDEYKNRGLTIIYAEQSKELTIDSDASGFQKALELLYLDGRNFNYVFFGHTKGSTSRERRGIDEDPCRQNLIIGIFKDKTNICTLLNDNLQYGSYGLDMARSAGSKGLEPFRIAGYFDSPFKSLGYFYLYTCFVIRGNIVRSFLSSCNNLFFKTNLYDMSCDRYFGERDLPQMAMCFGYIPYLINFLSIRDKINIDEVNSELQAFITSDEVVSYRLQNNL